jgi:poly(A) polymerase
MATTGVKPLGVTAPLSINPPTETEIQANATLIEELKRQNNYESAGETSKRYVSSAHIYDALNISPW